MDIKELKKETKLRNKDIAGFFNLNLNSFKASSAKRRYEKALCLFYEAIKTKQSKND